MLLFSNSNIYSQSLYFTYLNNFKTLNKSGMYIENKNLCDKNSTFDNKMNIITVNTYKSQFNTYIRFKNLNNNEDKQYTVYETNGESRKIRNSQWGFVWNFKNNQNYYAINLKGYNVTTHDILDERLLKIDIIRMCNGKKEVLKTIMANDYVNVYNGYNVVQVKYDGYITRVFIGSKQLKCIHELSHIEYGDSMGIGYVAGAGSDMRIERVVYNQSQIPELQLITKWNKSKIDKHLQNNVNHTEGQWKYLDRNIDNRNIKLGGKYTLTIIKSTNGDYDILYYDGAVVNSSKWKCGMLKGKLKRTQFQNNYDLVWYDATMRELSDDAYAEIESDKILTLYFPVEKSQLRFVKQ